MPLSLTIVIMGVAGSGKTTIGQLLVSALSAASDTTGQPWEFHDADAYHPSENRSKMAQGIPLTDEDRFTWLSMLHSLIESASQRETNVVLACSALKQKYRDILTAGEHTTIFVHLSGSYEQICDRLDRRQDHFFPKTLLRSQFDALEPPADALELSIKLSPQCMIDAITSYLHDRMLQQAPS